MNRLWIMLALALLTVALAPAATGAEELEGAKVYGDTCARCHPPQRSFAYTSDAWRIIVHHMRVRAFLTEAEVGAVLRYLQEYSSGAAQAPPAAPPGEGEGPLDGRALVVRNGCQGCHVIGGVGGQIGPPLDTLFERRDMEYVLRKLAEPTFDNPNSVMPKFLLTEEQRRTIAEYLAAVNRK